MACPTPPDFGLKAAPRPKLFQRLPPAVFPVILGGLGLVLAWRKAEAILGLPSAVSGLFGGVMGALYAIAAFGYAAKLARRPSVALEDLAILPGRAGLAAAVLGAYLVVAVLAPLWAGLAQAVFWLALALHGALVAALLKSFAAGAPEQRQVTPAWHLAFSGPVVAAVAALSLGMDALALPLFGLAFASALGIWGASVRQFLKASVPAPLRPLLAIHLAPLALLGTVALGLGFDLLAQGILLVSVLALLGALALLPWLTEAGFSPFWGAFTFPLAAMAGFWLSAGALWGGALVEGAGLLLTAFATMVTLPILYKTLQLWVKGQLAAKSNAAIA